MVLSLILVPMRKVTAFCEFVKGRQEYRLLLVRRGHSKKLLMVNFIAILIDGTTDPERPLLNSIKTIQRTKFLLHTLK